MRRRAEQVDRTRERITEATVRLHTTIGPSAASMSAIAEEAGVTRLTLYRHFASRDELFEACMSHWAERHPGPDVEGWRAIPLSRGRARRALREVYDYYRRNGSDLAPLYRDFVAWPESAQLRAGAQAGEMVDALLDGVRRRGAPLKRLRAAAGHALAFGTWRSLAVDQGLSDDEAVDLAVGFLQAASA